MLLWRGERGGTNLQEDLARWGRTGGGQVGAQCQGASHPLPAQHGKGPVWAVLLTVAGRGALLLAPAPAAAAALHHPAQRCPEPLSSKDVEEGVKAAVEEGNALGDLQLDVQPVGSLTAVCHPGVGVDGFDQQNNIVRELREEESGDDHGDDLQRLLLLGSFGLQEGVDDKGVTNNHHKEWEEESNCDFQGQDSNSEDRADVWWVCNFANCYVTHLRALAVQDFWDTQAHGCQPDSQAHEFAVQEPPLLSSFSFHCLDNSDVPVKADAG